MAYKTIAIFKLLPDKANEEIERCKSEDSMLNTLKKFPGFIDYEVVKISESSTMTIQTWETKEQFAVAIPNAMAVQKAINKERENIVESFDGFYGEIVISTKK